MRYQVETKRNYVNLCLAPSSAGLANLLLLDV